VTVKLHVCSAGWARVKAHPCWRVEKALRDMGVDYERVPGPMSKRKRTVLVEGTGQTLYPAIELADGTWYREESAAMERTIRAGRLEARSGASDAEKPEVH